MATITLDYNTRNVQAQKALDYILSLGYFRTHTAIEKPRSRRIIRHNSIKKLTQNTADPFAAVRGIWADREMVVKNNFTTVIPTPKSMKGALKQYANPTLIGEEKQAWATNVEEKYANI